MRGAFKILSSLLVLSSLAAMTGLAHGQTLVPVGREVRTSPVVPEVERGGKKVSAAPVKSNVDKAQAIFEELLIRTPDDPDVYRYLGDIYAIKREYKKAESFYRKYSEMRPGDYYAYYRLGDMYRDRDRGGKAKDEYREALDRIDGMEKPDLPADIAKARMLALVGEKDESDATFEDLMVKHPKDPDIANGYVETLIDTKRLKTAESVAEDELSQFPYDYRLRRNLLRTKMLRYKYDEAEDVLAALRDDFVDDENLRSDYAYLLYSEDDWYRAMPAYKELSEKYPHNKDYADMYDELFKRYRPTLIGGFGYRITGGDRFGPYLRYFHPINSQWMFETGYALNYNTSSIVPSDPNFSAITHDIPLIARYKPHRTLRLSSGVLNQLVDSSYVPAGLFFLDWNRPPWGQIAGLGEYNKVLDDPTSALAYDGRRETAALAYENTFYERLIFNALYSSRWYRVNSSKTPQDLGDEFGREDIAEAGLQYIILRRPQVTVGYNFRYSKLHIVNNYLDIIPLIEQSQRHLFNVGLFHEWNKWITTDAYGFFGADPKRDLGFGDLYGIAIYNRFKLSKRLEILAGYEYSSESLADTTGRYQYINFEVLYRF